MESPVGMGRESGGGGSSRSHPTRRVSSVDSQPRGASRRRKPETIGRIDSVGGPAQVFCRVEREIGEGGMVVVSPVRRTFPPQ